MSEQALTSPEKEPRHDEYAELRRRMVDGGWNPGDIFCTSQGVTRQFRETPYSSEFRRCRNGTGWNRLLRITASPGSRTMLDARLDCCAAESQRGAENIGPLRASRRFRRLLAI